VTLLDLLAEVVWTLTALARRVYSRDCDGCN
jgi:hypothetical protein